MPLQPLGRDAHASRLCRGYTPKSLSPVPRVYSMCRVSCVTRVSRVSRVARVVCRVCVACVSRVSRVTCRACRACRACVARPCVAADLEHLYSARAPLFGTSIRHGAQGSAELEQQARGDTAGGPHLEQQAQLRQRRAGSLPEANRQAACQRPIVTTAWQAACEWPIAG
jgi:hypothetical protein